MIDKRLVWKLFFCVPELLQSKIRIFYQKEFQLRISTTFMSQQQRLEFSESFTKRQLKEIDKVYWEIGKLFCLAQDRINGINVPHY